MTRCLNYETQLGRKPLLEEYDSRYPRFPGAHIFEQLPKHYCNINHNDPVNHKAQDVIKCLSLLPALVKHLPGAIYLLL